MNEANRVTTKGTAMDWQSKLARGFDRSLDILAVVAAAILVFATLSTTTEVVMRYFFNRPIGWVLEISQYALVYIPFLGAAWVLRSEGHVRVEILTQRLSTGRRLLVDTITSAICVVVCLIVMWYSAQSTLEHWRIGYFMPTTLATPKFIILAVIPFGFFLLTIQFVRRTRRYMIGWRVAVRRPAGRQV